MVGGGIRDVHRFRASVSRDLTGKCDCVMRREALGYFDEKATVVTVELVTEVMIAVDSVQPRVCHPVHVGEMRLPYFLESVGSPNDIVEILRLFEIMHASILRGVFTNAVAFAGHEVEITHHD